MPKKNKKPKILFVASEAAPYAKSGGLADVAGSLPRELRKLGIDARLILPKYRTVKEIFLKDARRIGSTDISLGWRRQSASILGVKANPDDEEFTYLIENDYFFGRDGFYGYDDDFDRFAFFVKAAIESVMLIGFVPDIIHFNDWQTGLGCVYLKDIYHRFLAYENVKSLFTIHNLQYQGIFGREILNGIDINDGYFTADKLEFFGKVSFMKAGLTYADAISTVSETYAHEIRTPRFGYRLDGMLRSRAGTLHGILNGIDYNENDPYKDKRIFAHFSANDFAVGDFSGKAKNKIRLQKMLNLPIRDDVPMMAIISRLVDQKGLDIFAGAIGELLQRDIQLVVLGTGDYNYENMFKDLAWRHPDKISANICFNEDLAYKIYAASDMFLMPSLFEPCGLGQIIAMRYGSVPIVRKTGGLGDTVSHYDRETQKGNGFVFDHYMTSSLIWGIDEALSVYHDKEEWNKVVQNAAAQDFSWKASAKKYIELYSSIISN